MPPESVLGIRIILAGGDGTVNDDLTKEDCQHILEIMNCWSPPECEHCSSIRQKLEKKISGDYTEEKVIGGFPVTVIHERS